jgi:hypothetical protein
MDEERRSPANLGFEPDLSLVFPHHHAVRQRQPLPRPRANLSRGEERLEYAPLNVGRNPMSRIAHRDLGKLPPPPRAHSNLSLFGLLRPLPNSMRGIHNQIQHYLVDLARMAQHRGQRFVEVRRHLGDVLPFAARNRKGRRNPLVQIAVRFLRHVRMGKLLHRPHDRRHTPCPLQTLFDRLRYLGAQKLQIAVRLRPGSGRLSLRQRFSLPWPAGLQQPEDTRACVLEEREVVGHKLYRRVDLVRNPGGHLPDHLQLLGLAKFSRQGEALGDVFLNGKKMADRAVRGGDRRNRRRFPIQLTVLLPVSKFAPPLPPFANRLPQGRVHFPRRVT